MTAPAPRHERFGGRGLVVAITGLLATTTFLGVAMFRQVDTLERDAAATESIVNADVRTLGQTQREVLRLEALLASGADDAGAIELQAGFVSQRMTEIENTDHLEALRSDSLDATASALADQWATVTEPMVRGLVALPADDWAARQDVLDQLRQIELGFNSLAANAEGNRREQAGAANASIVDVLHSSRLLLAVLIGTLLGFLAFVGWTARRFVRHERERNAAAADLVALNTELHALKDAAEETAEAKAQFLANMSHEIRTPLNAVIALNELLLDTPLTPQQRQWAETARNSGDLLLALVNDILTVSAIDAGRLELEDGVVDLDELIGATLRLFESQADERGVVLEHHIDPNVPAALRGDANRLTQVLVNLVGNGVKFTEHGAVRVSVRSDGLDADGHHLVDLVVEDTGVGIAADRLDRVFRPFTQGDASTSRKYGGTGLGLAICRGLVERMGGTIRIDSVPGSGTTVRVRLLMRTADAAPDTPAADVRPAVETVDADLRVLLVEDDPVNQHVAMALLRKLGVYADLAEDGLEALEAVRNRAYDVVLMDIHLPNCDGPTATKRIRSELPAHRQPRIVALTANALEGDRERFLAAGMDGYVSKPARLHDLALALRATGHEQVPLPAVDPMAVAAYIGVDDPELVAQLVAAFVADATPIIEQLAGCPCDDPPGLGPLAGRLRAMAAGAGAAAVADAAEALQAACAAGDAEQVHDLVSRLPGLFAPVEAWLRDSLTRA